MGPRHSCRAGFLQRAATAAQGFADDVPAEPDCTAAVVVALARSQSELQAARSLLASLYAARGYLFPALDGGREAELILLATADGDAVGTLAVRFDGPEGLRADESYRAELDAVRAQGRSLCEFGRFAVARGARSSGVIGALFRRAGGVVRARTGVTDVFIEVHPRHAAFYRRAFGFRVVADERPCPRVLAPALLLRLDVAAFEGRPHVVADGLCAEAKPEPRVMALA
jgi:GNAT superfamily N-acetyltransferase